MERFLFLVRFHPSSVNAFYALPFWFRFLFAPFFLSPLPNFWHLSIYRGSQGEKFERSGSGHCVRLPSSSSFFFFASVVRSADEDIKRSLCLRLRYVCQPDRQVVIVIVVVVAHPCLMARRKALPRRQSRTSRIFEAGLSPCARNILILESIFHFSLFLFIFFIFFFSIFQYYCDVQTIYTRYFLDIFQISIYW